jgi:hypothetical protein
MPDRTIAERPTARGETLRVALSEFRGRHYLNVRTWYRDSAGELKPGRGLSLAVTLLPWLRRQLEVAEAAALEAGLLDEEAYESCGLALPAELGGAEC